MSVGRASAVMAAGTMTSRVLGLVRASLLGSVVGVATASADAFEVANTLPNQFYLLLAGGILNAVLVPQIVKARALPDGGAEFLGRILTASVLLISGAAALATLAAPLLVRLFSDFQDPAQLHLAVIFAWICMPQILFYGLYTLLGQVLNAHGRFGAYMWAPVVANLVAIAGLLAFRALGYPLSPSVGAWTPQMIAVLAGSATASIAVQAAFLIVPLRRLGLAWKPSLRLRGVGLGTASTVAKWTLAAVAVSQLGFAVTSKVLTRAQGLGELAGSPTAGRFVYALAFLVAMLPHSLITVSVVTALFPRMSRAVHDADHAALRADIRMGLRTPSVVLAPATAFAIAFAPEIAATMLPGNNLQQTATLVPVIAALMLGVVPFGWIYVNERVFYAHDDARTPFLLQVVTSSISVIVSLAALLVPFRDTAWVVGLGQSLAYSVSALIGFVVLGSRLGPLGVGSLLGYVARILLPAAVIAVGLRYAVDAVFPPLEHSRLIGAAALVVAAGIQMVLTLSAARLLGVEEVGEVVRSFTRRFRR